MLYGIKFLYTVLVLPPGCIIWFMCGWAVWEYHRKKKWNIAVMGMAVLLYVASSPFLAEKVVGSLEDRYDPAYQQDGDVIVVLGGGAVSGTPNLTGKGHLSGSGANRLLAGLQLHKKTGLPLILSGGQVYASDGCEGDIGRQILLDAGVSADCIIVDGESKNTADNARFVEKILRERGMARPILVTSAFHMERSMLQFQKYGVQMVPWPADYQISRKGAADWRQVVPSAAAMELLAIGLKEYVGIWASSVY